jgi:hypothetical protein
LSEDPANYEEGKAWGEEHIGDLWRCTESISSQFSTTNSKKVSRAKNSEWVWKELSDGEYGWYEMEIPNNIFDAYDGKATMHITKPENGYKIRDLWILDETT